MAVLAACFLGEGLWVYAHQLHHYGTAVLWVAIGLIVAIVLTRTARDLLWLPATLALAIAAEAVLAHVYARTF